MPPFVDLSGQRFSRWLVVSKITINKRVYWNCVCDCGTKRAVCASSLKSGTSRSCGCYEKDARKTTARYLYKRHPKLFRCWSNMLQRCTNKNNNAYHNYGGRGITVCSRWLSFENFLNDVGEYPPGKLTLDRIKNNLGYEPGNVRWATPEIQGENKRTSRLYTYNGVTKCIKGWTRHFGLPATRLYHRLSTMGMPFEEAIKDIPLNRRRLTE